MNQQQVKVGVGVLIWKDGKVALIKRSAPYGNDTWSPPGGHVEFGESVLETAHRETLEEVGVKIENLDILGFIEDISIIDNAHYITIWVRSDWASGELKATDIEFSKSGFFSMKDLPGPLFISFENLVNGKLLPKELGPIS